MPDDRQTPERMMETIQKFDAMSRKVERSWAILSSAMLLAFAREALAGSPFDEEFLKGLAIGSLGMVGVILLWLANHKWFMFYMRRRVKRLHGD